AAARAAQSAPDLERGLDAFLGQLPTDVLQPAGLSVDPPSINLGILHPGEDRRFELTLHNKGMRLVFGSASCDDSPWLSLGEGVAQRSKVFQFWGQAPLQ